MLCIGYAQSAPDEGLRSIDRKEPLTRLRLAKPPAPTRGEGEECERRYSPFHPQAPSRSCKCAGAGAVTLYGIEGTPTYTTGDAVAGLPA